MSYTLTKGALMTRMWLEQESDIISSISLESGIIIVIIIIIITIEIQRMWNVKQR